MEPGLGPGWVGVLKERYLLCHLCQTLAPDILGVLVEWAAPEPCLSLSAQAQLSFNTDTLC